MKAAVVDASVAVKWVIQEAHAEAAATLLADTALHAPAHWLAEAVNAVWGLAFRGTLTGPDALERARALADAPVASTPLAGLIEPAMDTAIEYGITVYDALYVALGVQRGIPVVTADWKLVRKLKQGAMPPCTIIWVGDLGSPAT